MSRRKVSREYEDLKAWVVEAARVDLEKSYPAYVSEFRRLLDETHQLDAATLGARPHLTSGLPRWPALLTAFFDFEYVRGKVVDCHKLLERTKDDPSADGSFWFTYHMDHWVFQTDAFMDRSDRLFRQIVRTAIRPLDPGWKTFEHQLAAQVRVLKEPIANVRNPLAHGLGSGVAGILDKWEPILAAPFNVFDEKFVESSVSGFKNTVEVGRRRSWFRGIHRANLLLFAYSEALSGTILKRIREFD